MLRAEYAKQISSRKYENADGNYEVKYEACVPFSCIVLSKQRVEVRSFAFIREFGFPDTVLIVVRHPC